MSDDLVQRLRANHSTDQDVWDAADRIEALEAALKDILDHAVYALCPSEDDSDGCALCHACEFYLISRAKDALDE